MASTVKLIHIAMTKENLRQLGELVQELGESNSEVMKRALTVLHYITFNQYVKFDKKDYE